MTDEELDKITQEIAAEIEQFSGDFESPLGKAEKKHLRILGARLRALERIRAVKEKGSVDQEAKACMEYAMITEYAEKNPILLALLRVRLATWPRF